MKCCICKLHHELMQLALLHPQIASRITPQWDTDVTACRCLEDCRLPSNYRRYHHMTSSPPKVCMRRSVGGQHAAVHQADASLQISELHRGDAHVIVRRQEREATGRRQKCVINRFVISIRRSSPHTTPSEERSGEKEIGKGSA